MVRTIPFVVAKVKRLRDDDSEDASTNSDSRTSAAATNIKDSDASRDTDSSSSSSSSNNLSYEDAVEQSAHAVIKAVKDLVTMSRSLEESGGREGSSLSANYELDRVAKRMDAWMAQQVRKGETVVKIRSGGKDWGMSQMKKLG